MTKQITRPLHTHTHTHTHTEVIMITAACELKANNFVM